MKKFCLIVFGLSFLFVSYGTAQNKVVVIPLLEKPPMADFYPFPYNPNQIPDPGSVSVNVGVPSSAGIIKKVEIVLAIEHNSNSDIHAKLTDPFGKEVWLFTKIGGLGASIYVHLSDDAEMDIGEAISVNGQPLTGIYNIEGGATLSVFHGSDASGTWTLTLWDDTYQNINGYLRLFGLYIFD